MLGGPESMLVLWRRLRERGAFLLGRGKEDFGGEEMGGRGRLEG